MNEVYVASAFFTGLILILVLVVMFVRAVLRIKGVARLMINGGQVIEGEMGDTLLGALDQGGVRLPTSCGGMGTCGLCRVRVLGSEIDLIVPVERIALNDAEIAQGTRLACQVILRGNLDVTVPVAFLGAKNWQCKVLESRSLTPLIKEIVLDWPAAESQVFPAGRYVIVVAPPYELSYADIDIAAAHENDWKRMGLRHLRVENKVEQNRAYSLVNQPNDTHRLILNIRLALPPSMNPQVPPGVVSSYLFGLKPGDTVLVSGHYGDFFIRESDREIIFIGGGVGMAPLYAHVHDQLHRLNSKRIISYWYGARGPGDLYYLDEMETLAREHENFSWHVAISEPEPDHGWTGKRGFIHDVIYAEYLSSHPNPQNCEYYLCGPPLMIKAVRVLLDRLGVPPDNIFHDDFGA